MSDRVEEFRIERHAGDPTVIAVFGEVDLATAPEVGQALTDALAQGRVTLDLSGVTFLDSSGLRAILIAHQAAANGTFTLTGASPATRRLLELTGVGDVVGIDDDG